MYVLKCITSFSVLQSNPNKPNHLKTKQTKPKQTPKKTKQYPLKKTKSKIQERKRTPKRVKMDVLTSNKS